MLIAGLVAAIPVFVSVIRALSAGWLPEGDQAVTVTRALDVLTSETPLVGVWSTTSRIIDDPTFSPGPLLYWLLALPGRMGGDAVFPILMGVVNGSAVIGAVALAHRRGGGWLMVATAAAIAVMCASLPTQVMYEIWSPSAPLLPFMLLIFVAWSVACGDVRLLPLAVLLFSFTTQCHLVFLVPSAALLAVGVAGLVLVHRRDRRLGREDRGSLRRWTLMALVVAGLCWSAPLVDQALVWNGSDRGYGNLANVVEVSHSRDVTVGERGGAREPWLVRLA